jgi:uncharacterized caspase-like protein
MRFESGVGKSIRLTRCAVVLALLAAVLLASGLHAQTGKRSIRQRTAGSVSKLPEKSKRWALIIGVNEYSDKSHFQTLQAAVNDANALKDALVNYGGFPEEQVILLTSNQPEEKLPTRNNIYREIGLLQGNVPKDGLLIVAFSGHGMESSGQVFLAPSDTQSIVLEDTALSATKLMEYIKTMGVSQVLLILDACRNNPNGRGAKSNRMTPAYKSAFDFYGRNKEVEAFATLFATGLGQVSWENKKTGMGYFTEAVVEGLKGAAANEKGEVTLERLVGYVEVQVPARTRRDLGEVQKPNRSIYGYKASDLVIAHEISSAVQGSEPLTKDQTSKTTSAQPSATTTPPKPSATRTIKNTKPPVIPTTELSAPPAVERAKPSATTESVPPSHTSIANPGIGDPGINSSATAEARGPTTSVATPSLSVTVVSAPSAEVEKITIERRPTGILQAEPKGSLLPKNIRNGVLFVLVSPSSASVVIKTSRGRVVNDNQSVQGEFRTELPPGIYDVEVYAPNCLSSSTRTSVTAGSAVKVPVELTPSTGSVSFETAVSDVTVLIDGGKTGDLNIRTNRTGNRIELLGVRAGFHSFRITHPTIKDWEIARLEVQGGAATRVVPIFKPVVVLASGFSDDFSEGARFWTIPQNWSVNHGMIVRDSGLGLLRGKVYQDFRMEFEVDFIKGKDVAWVVRASDGKNYYLFHLSGPGSASPYRFRSFICIGGVIRGLRNVDVPKDLFSHGSALRIIVEGRGETVRHSVQTGGNRETVQTQKLDALSDKTFVHGLVGFKAVPSAEARIRFVRIALAE